MRGGAGVEKHARRLVLAEECRQMEGGETVRRNGRGAVGILLEPLPKPIDVTERRGVEHVHLRIGGEQGVEGRTVEAVARVQQGRHAVFAAFAREGCVVRQQCLHPRRVPGVDGGQEIVRGGHGARVLRDPPGRRVGTRAYAPPAAAGARVR